MKNQTIITEDSFGSKGSLLQIYTYPSPILKKVAQEVSEFDDDLKKLCEDMLYTMYMAPGIGLAAPQVGVSKRVFVMDIDFNCEEVTNSIGQTEYRLNNLNPRVFINPVIKNKKGELLYEEGCLSVPGIFESVKRAKEITVEYHDLNGEKLSFDADDTLSVCIQHENDHLDGIVFLERLSLLKKNLLTKKFLKQKKKNG
ncbi:peptide deformylase [Bacteriovoracaceae bacterium]|nr:peptide deformylase [Bacteriovoracaceae bacterium]